MNKPITGIDVTFSSENPHIEVANTLQQAYPHHIILVQAGTFLHAFNQSAYVLHTLKQYKLILAGPADKPHLRVGLPVANFKKKLWPLVDAHNLSYVAHTKDGLQVVDAIVPSILLDTVSPDIVDQVISDLITHKQLQTANTKKLLQNPQTQEFIFKTKAVELDYKLLDDMVKVPRDIRTTWGENVRETMQRIMRNTFLYGNEDNKPQLLKQLSADVDLLKHYMSQAQALNRFKFAFEHRVSLVVELGRILGGLQRAQKAQP